MIQSNQIVLITGGGSGIGLALAQKFLENNNTVIITGRNLSKLEKVKNENPKIHIYQSDVTDDPEVRMLVDNILQKFGGLDVLINNAGIMNLVDAGNQENDLQKQMQEIEINYNSPIRVLHYFLPLLKKSKNAVLVNVSSGLAYVPFAQAPVYSGTKSALHFWTLGIRPQLKPHGIKVVELLPPVVRTDIFNGIEVNEADLKPILPAKLADLFWKDYIKGKEEITPGISKKLKLMSRLAPRFIFKQLNKKPIPNNK
ncbi:MAG: SDR family NAD(P)-dependent oxidoreductase [Melioribacteraceae bacterium]|nr:SDR family NAD(P)-dependent oxidoreductase [Melioribacteraceae bacterium]MCF8263376.1 SDR family NAD(P)-dependent oxidoreductase [Melioribacteraceae bacterium]MCF8430862.1 SDR family NAD(P)-dependent oxidoreductase [Melioribacteraceae bacterium]